MVDNKIGAEGAQSLAQALQHNSTLTTLDLWGSDFTFSNELLTHVFTL